MNPGLFKNHFPPSVRAFFTDTAIDFLLPPDVQVLSTKQKAFLSEVVGLDPQSVFMMRQVHGDRVLTVAANDLPQKDNLPEADAMITNAPGVVLSVRTADCLPVFIFDPKTKAIGLVHAGWKSSAFNIVAETLKALKKNYSCQASDVFAAFGPAIGPCCYEVGEEFVKIFPAEVFRRQDKIFLDLALVNRKQLLAAGVQDKHIFVSEDCTVCTSGYFSFRRDQDNAGRHLSLLWLSGV